MSTDAIAIQNPLLVSRPWTETLHEWVTTVDHKRIGLLYIAYALLFLVIAGVEAMIMRIQLMHSHNTFVTPQVFNRMFTMHGTTMIFYVAVPVLFGFANYLVPLMIGSPRLWQFPRLNAFSFWLTALSGFVLYFSFLGGNGLYGAGSAPDIGWWAYAPLTAKAFSPGHSSDYWTIAILVAGFGSIGTAINIIATVLCMRCPGMRLGRMPLLAWLNLVMSGMVLIAITPLTAAQMMLLVDRYRGGHFFDTQAGGAAVVWMQFFWIFGHPEVYFDPPSLPSSRRSCPCFRVSRSSRISGDGRSHRLHRIRQHERVGAPHVHGGNEFLCQQLFHHHLNGGGNPDGNQDLQLAWDHVGRADPVQNAHVYFARFLFQFLIAGLTGIMLASAPFDLPTE